MIHLTDRLRVVCVVLLCSSGLLSGAGVACAQELETGFYIVMPTDKKCPNRLRNIDGTRYFCLPKEPIIYEREFEKVGEILYDSINEVNYLIITLTPEGFRNLRILTQKLPDSHVALVTGGRVAGIFENPDRLVNRMMPIMGGKNYSDIKWIYDRLKKLKE